MSRTLVDLLFFTGSKGGMESYVRNLYENMPTTDDEYIAFGSREFAALDSTWFPGEVIDSGLSGENRRAWAWGELTAVSSAARRVGADLIHAPANLGPWRSSIPVVLTVHDLLAFRHPEFLSPLYGAALRTLVATAARRARRVITISSPSATDIETLLGIDPGRIDVIPLAGPHVSVAPRRPEANLLLALGNRLPHKNFESLVRAIGLIPAASRPRLVITGGIAQDPLRALVDRLELTDWIELLQWIPDSDIDSLYSRATAVVVPSLFEGFGLPVLEAMARGCPVLCSNLDVLAEVAGDAAVFFDPTDDRAIATAIERTVGDDRLLTSMSTAGRVRAGTFSWKRTAEQTLQSFHTALA